MCSYCNVVQESGLSLQAFHISTLFLSRIIETQTQCCCTFYSLRYIWCIRSLAHTSLQESSLFIPFETPLNNYQSCNHALSSGKLALTSVNRSWHNYDIRQINTCTHQAEPVNVTNNWFWGERRKEWTERMSEEWKAGVCWGVAVG